MSRREATSYRHVCVSPAQYWIDRYRAARQRRVGAGSALDAEPAAAAGERGRPRSRVRGALAPGLGAAVDRGRARDGACDRQPVFGASRPTGVKSASASAGRTVTRSSMTTRAWPSPSSTPRANGPSGSSTTTSPATTARSPTGRPSAAFGTSQGRTAGAPGRDERPPVRASRGAGAGGSSRPRSDRVLGQGCTSELSSR